MIGRRPFLDGLEQRMEDAEKLKLFEGRRSGKTSATRAVVTRFAQRGRPAAAIDLARVADAKQAALRLAEQLAPGLEAIAAAGRPTTWLGSAVGALVEHGERLEAVQAALMRDTAGPGDVLDHCASALADTPAAVLIDEAHHLASWDESDQQAVREFLRNDTRVGVMIASSERHALDELTEPDGPLEYAGHRLPMPRVAREDWEAELPRRFDAVGSPITGDGLSLLLDESRGHGYCTMFLARESARLGAVTEQVDDMIVRAALHIVERDELWELRDDGV